MNAKPTPKRILVVEDDAHIAEGLALNLTLQGYAVRGTADGVSALRIWKEWRPDLIVLDVMLPGIDGLSVLQSIRLEDARLPVLILSARGGSEDKVRGFSYGVDDYIAKPFDLDEFLMRVERLLTRSAWQAESGAATAAPTLTGIYRFGPNQIDFSTATARCQAGVVTLTDQEVRLLRLFISNRGKPLSRQALLAIGWGYSGGTETRTVDNFMVRLRRYFETDPKQPKYFRSMRAIGYLFDHE
jgi:DNA-binding response OmpR family regulator